MHYQAKQFTAKKKKKEKIQINGKVSFSLQFPWELFSNVCQSFIPKHIINSLNVHTHRVFIYDVRATRTKHLFHLSAFHCELLQMYESSAI